MGIIMILICLLYVTQIEWDNFSNHKKSSTYHFFTIAGVNCPTQRQLTPYFIAHIAIPGVNFPTQGKFTPCYYHKIYSKRQRITRGELFSGEFPGCIVLPKDNAPRVIILRSIVKGKV